MKQTNLQLKENKQRGAVIVTVLLLLVVITLMGLSSMQQGMMQARMGAAEVAYNSCFIASEAGLNAVYRNFQTQSYNGNTIKEKTNDMNKAFQGAGIKHCLGDGGFGVMSGDTCPKGELAVFGEMAVTMRSRQADPNNPTEKSNLDTFETEIGRGEIILLYTDSRCEMESVDLAVVNTQAWQHRVSNSLPRHGYTGR